MSVWADEQLFQAREGVLLQPLLVGGLDSSSVLLLKRVLEGETGLCPTQKVSPAMCSRKLAKEPLAKFSRLSGM
jgi:hypothetical protein